MSRNTKIVLGVVGGILALCCIGAVVAFAVLPTVATRFFEQTYVEDPEQAAQIGQSIVDYDLPAGFMEEGAMEMMGINVVFMVPELRRQEAYIMLMSFPAAMAGNEAQMRRQMEETFSQQTGQRDVNMTYEGSEEITINGEPATLTIYEGTDQDGTVFRQASAIFQANGGGPGMVMLFGPVSEWETLGMAHFLQSME